MTEGWSYYLDFNNQMFELEEGERTVGRSRTCDVSVNDPSVSRRHVVLKAANGRILLKDLGSSNGTFINGERIQEAGELHHGDTLGLGDADLNVRVIGTSAFETVRMQAHPLEGQHGEATLFLQKASQDLAQEAMDMEPSQGPGHMAPPAPAPPAPAQPPVNPAQTQPPSAAGFAAPPAPQPPAQVVPEPTSPWAAPAAPAAPEPPPAAPAPPQRSTQEVTAEGVRYADLGVPTSPPQPGPPAQQAPPPSDVSRPTLPTPNAAPPLTPEAQPAPPSEPALATPQAPPVAMPQTPVATPQAPAVTSQAPVAPAPQAPAAPSPAPAAPVAPPQAPPAPAAANPQTPPAPAPPQVAPNPAAPQAPQNVQTDAAGNDLLPSLDGFDVTMGPEMLAAMPAKEEKTEEAPAYNPYSAPSPQGNAAGAGFGIRLLAFLVDQLWMLAIGAGLFLAGQGQMVASTAASGIGFLVILFGWAIWGTTPGKRLFNLYVTAGDQAAGIGFPRALARIVGYVASTIPIFIGFLMIAFSKQRRGLHDIIAKTTVRRQ